MLMSQHKSCCNFQPEPSKNAATNGIDRPELSTGLLDVVVDRVDGCGHGCGSTCLHESVGRDDVVGRYDQVDLSERDVRSGGSE